MRTVNLRVPGNETPELLDDLTAWAGITGVDPVPTCDQAEGLADQDRESERLYRIYVSASFFEQFSRWRSYVEL